MALIEQILSGELIPALISAIALLKTYWFFLPITFVLVRFIRRRYFHPLSHFPGPFLASITHWYSVYDYVSWEMHIREQKLHEKYGPVVRYKPDMLLISDPKYLPIAFHMTVDKTEFQDMEITGFGEATLTARKHKDHARIRKKVAGAYSMTNTRRMEPYIDEQIVSLVKHLYNRFAKTGAPCDFSEWTQFFAYDVITNIAFGGSVGFMESGTDVKSLITSYHVALPVQAVLIRIRWLAKLIAKMPGLKMMMPKPTDKIGTGAMWGFRDQLIVERVKSGNQPKRQDLLYHFLNAKNEDGSPAMTRKNIADESYLIMAAGSDTTSATLRYLFKELLAPHNTHILTALLAELRSASLSPIPTYDSTQKLPYLQAVMSEALRLGGSIPLFLPRVVSRPGFEINGLFVPGDSIVAMNPWIVSRDKKLWGEDAEVFRPERWLGLSEKERFEYARYDFAFGYGSRACLGKYIALMEMNKVVVVLLKLFEMRLKSEKEGVPYPHEIYNLSLFQEKGFWIDVKVREEFLDELNGILGTAN